MVHRELQRPVTMAQPMHYCYMAHPALLLHGKAYITATWHSLHCYMAKPTLLLHGTVYTLLLHGTAYILLLHGTAYTIAIHGKAYTLLLYYCFIYTIATWHSLHCCYMANVTLITTDITATSLVATVTINC